MLSTDNQGSTVAYDYLEIIVRLEEKKQGECQEVLFLKGEL